MDRPTLSNPKRSTRATRSGDAPALILCAASVALCSLAFGLFERTPAGMRPLLQPSAIRESGWLSTPTGQHRAFDAVQESASIGVGQTVFLVLLAGMLVAGVAFWSLLLTRHTQRKNELATRSALGATPRELFFELARPLSRVVAAGTGVGVV